MSLLRVPPPRSTTQLARKHILHQKLDVLIALDHGMDAFMFSLLHARVAPVQMVYWSNGGGHAASMGLPDAVDYYLTGDSPSPDTMQDDFNEQVRVFCCLVLRRAVLLGLTPTVCRRCQVVRLGDFGIHLAEPDPITEAERYSIVSRLSLFDSRHLFVIPRLLVSLHPDFDEVCLCLSVSVCLCL